MQVIVFQKESGIICQLMSFHSQIEITLEKLNLGKKYDIEKLDFIIENDDVYVDLKKDRILGKKVCKLQNKQPFQKIPQKTITPQAQEESSFSLFDDVSIRRLPQHVGFITPWNDECGISNYSRDLIDNFLCKTTIFCCKNNNTDYDRDVKVIPCWTNRDSSYGHLVTQIKNNSIDVVHVQYNHDMMNAGELKNFGRDLRELGIRTIMTLHSTKGGVDIFGKFFDEIIVHSKVSADDIIGENTMKEQVHIIPIGTKSPFQFKTKEEACALKNLDPNRKIISNFGFLLPQKGVKEQIKSVARIKQEIPDILLLVVCSIHKHNENMSLKYYEECKSLVKELNLQDNVSFFTDYLPYSEIFDYLYCSDLIVLPYVNSAAQASSSAGRTAIIAGRPVLGTNVEIFSDLDGIIPKVEAGNVELLSIKIIEILNDERQQAKILSKISDFVEETSWENVAKEHQKIYKAFGDIKIDIVGQVYSYFSASVVNRNLACALDDLGVDVTLTSVGLAENTNYKTGDNSKELEKRKKHKKIVLQHQFPPNFNIEGEKKLLYLMAETSLPDEWTEKIRNSDIDHIFGYTNHAVKLIKESSSKPTSVLRCGVDERLFNDNINPINFLNIPDSYTKKKVMITEKTFKFLFVGHAQERKNFRTIFISYLLEFSKKDDSVFIIKSYDGGEIHKTILDIIQYVTIDLNKSKEDLPKYLYIYEDTDPEILPCYYKAANVMVQCSRAEGFGKPIVEAMRLGIPSIAIDWSGPHDFVTKDNAFLVPYKLVQSEYHVQSKNTQSVWADCTKEDLGKVMRFAFTHPEEIEAKGKQALKDSKRWVMSEIAFEFIKFIRKNI